jgi:hypothetical protein
MNQLAAKLNLPPKMAKFYDYMEELDDLKLGRYVRWIHMDNLKKIYNGGFLVLIGDVCTCKNGQGALFTFVFEDNLVFQKMSNDEIIIKYAKEIASRT